MEWVLVLTLWIGGVETGLTVTSWYETEKDCWSAQNISIATIPRALAMKNIAVNYEFKGECAPAY